MQIRNLTSNAGLIILLPVIIAFLIAEASAASIEVPRVSVEQAKEMLADPDAVIIDVRTAKAWWKSTTKILNAVREELGSMEQWAGKYPKDKTLIFYCS